MASRSVWTSRVLGTAVGVLALILSGQAVLDARPRDDRAAGCNEGDEPQACVPASPAEPEPRDEIVPRRDACAESGYLCLDPSEPDSFRVLRWPDPGRVLVVLVPTPDEASASARALQRAATRGVLRWDGSPMRIRVTHRLDRDEVADVKIRWTHQLDDYRLGVTKYEWRRRSDEISFRITDLALVTRDPYDLGRLVSAEVAELAAAHEMGHALGLGHSDSTQDVMYPENTAVRLTARDYATVEALYRLPNGALVR